VEEFLYQHGSPTQPKVDKAKVVALFEKYKGTSLCGPSCQCLCVC